MHQPSSRVSTTLALLCALGLESSTREPAQIHIDASEFALQAAPKVEAGRTRLQLQNLGLLDHHIRVLRLDSTRSFREFERALIANGAVPSWAVDVGGFEPTTGGAARSTAIRLNAGVHVLICTASLSDGSSMAMKGMYRSIEVHAPAPVTSTRKH